MMFWDQVLRVSDLVASSLATGALGYGVWLFAYAYRRRLRKDTGPWLVVIFTLGLLFLLAAGVGAEVDRIDQRVSVFTPLHLAGSILTLWALVLTVRRDRRVYAIRR